MVLLLQWQVTGGKLASSWHLEADERAILRQVVNLVATDHMMPASQTDGWQHIGTVKSIFRRNRGSVPFKSSQCVLNVLNVCSHTFENRPLIGSWLLDRCLKPRWTSFLSVSRYKSYHLSLTILVSPCQYPLCRSHYATLDETFWYLGDTPAFIAISNEGFMQNSHIVILISQTPRQDNFPMLIVQIWKTKVCLSNSLLLLRF